MASQPTVRFSSSAYASITTPDVWRGFRSLLAITLSGRCVL